MHGFGKTGMLPRPSTGRRRHRRSEGSQRLRQVELRQASQTAPSADSRCRCSHEHSAATNKDHSDQAESLGQTSPFAVAEQSFGRACMFHALPDLLPGSRGKEESTERPSSSTRGFCRGISTAGSRAGGSERLRWSEPRGSLRRRQSSPYKSLLEPQGRSLSCPLSVQRQGSH